jgi:hypothetical protein
MVRRASQTGGGLITDSTSSFTYFHAGIFPAFFCAATASLPIAFARHSRESGNPVT